MALSAHLEINPANAGRRRAARKRLRLETRGAMPNSSVSSVLIHNISATGLLLETALPLKVRESIDVELPHAGLTTAQVLWASGNMYGCQFEAAISSATLSAAQLKSAATTGQESQDGSSRENETFGAKLRRLRNARKLTLAQIAERVGVSKPSVWSWEMDRARPSSERIEVLAEVLGVPARDLLLGGDISQVEGLLAKTRERIATSYGTSPDKVRIMIDL